MACESAAWRAAVSDFRNFPGAGLVLPITRVSFRALLEKRKQCDFLSTRNCLFGLRKEVHFLCE